MYGSGQQAAAASQNANGTALAGTLIGAAAGAALGAIGGNAGVGAAVGSGAGLLGGASVAGSQAQAAADSMQARYDTFYAQCMVGNGEVIQQPPVVYAAPPGYYVYP
jgi:lipid-binding SYLF domain-containing protein